MRSVTETQSTWLARARALHRRAIVIDTHVDTTQHLLRQHWNIAERHVDGHVDIPRLREGGIDAVFFAVYASGPLPRGQGAAAARRQIDTIHQVIERHPADLALARTSGEICRAKSAGRIAVLLAIEGGYLIEDSLEVLREFHDAGAIYMTLTHGFHTTWADSAGIHQPLEPRHRGLTDFGREVVREMNRLGMIVDVSHVSDDTFWHVLETSCAPVLATHSSCRAVSPHRRNLSDDMIRALAERGGCVQINFHAGFIDPTFPPLSPEAVAAHFAAGLPRASGLTEHVTPLAVLADHFDHALRLVGPDHVGIGSDFDGVPALPAGMEDCSCLPLLTATLLERGHSEADLTRLLGANVLRVLDDCAAVAAPPAVGIRAPDRPTGTRL